jgi:response regulator RpfG family c-di-GMP phosphodiesterase
LFVDHPVAGGFLISSVRRCFLPLDGLILMSQLMTPTKPAPQKTEAAAVPGAPVRPMVLLLEDENSSSDAMTQLLDHYGCDVKHARTLLEAMPLLPMMPKFAILDLLLPDGGGERVLDLIRRRKLTTKVIILTGCRDRDRLKEVARLKPDLILTKPLDFFRLLEFIRSSI